MIKAAMSVKDVHYIPPRIPNMTQQHQGKCNPPIFDGLDCEEGKMSVIYVKMAVHYIMLCTVEHDDTVAGFLVTENREWYVPTA